MQAIEMSGAPGWANRGGAAATQADDRAAPASGAAAAPVAPTLTVAAVLQSRSLDRAEPQDAQRSLMLQSQSLALARQEEMRLQQKLASLRETIVETENRLREMQAVELEAPAG